MAIERERLTITELMRLFGKNDEDSRWIASVDAEGYLAVVMYLVQRANS